ncbi:extracellular solute-binding protein [Streptomyces sp. NBC_00201]|uniref:extracellular solute-binding protein n=1 Tax=unclassified Streptomyces TaxID=2593676 RepID=UPI002257431D|nr:MULTISPECIES: extracellular solute-binding protein [unclassified Streptomyces]MCX5063168.1 extracellular solute-binding protein [Streptomyces sp. NBC_00452]MCX5251008.1 extracellular solute-binding protein [Streptomyces sp. NBC_00201]MCX5291063.1 extracellular solute-binding protein [Streptomyces sp. NBC_00183]
MRRRRLLALTSVGLVSACGLEPGGSGRRTVTAWLMKDSASQSFLSRFTEAFERDHPNLRLDIRIQQWTGIGQKVQHALDADSGNGPDVIEVGNTQVPQYVEGGRLLDLTLESSLRWGSERWLPGLAEPGQFLSHQYGIPWYAANRVVIYRKDLFAQAGIRKLPRTRAEWLTVTETLNSGGNQGIYLAGQDWYTLAGFIWDEGGDLADDGDGEGWRGTLDTQAAQRGMDFYRRLHALGDGPSRADEEHPPQAGVFAAGKVAQIVAVPGLARTVVQQNPDLKDTLGFFPVPGRTAAHPGAVFTGGSDLVVPNNTRERDGAVALVGALTGAKWDTELARTMNYVPNKRSLARAVDGEEGVAAMAAGAAQGRATPSTPQWGAVEADNPIKDYMTRVLTGADPATEARRASRRITEVLNRLN